MVHSFHDIIHVDGLISHSDGICLEDISRLIMRYRQEKSIKEILFLVFLCSISQFLKRNTARKPTDDIRAVRLLI